MTLDQLVEEVCALGFENTVEADSQLLTAANRALRLIFSERGSYATSSLIAAPIKPVFYLPLYEHRGSALDTIHIEGRAFSFKVSGKGELRVTDKSGQYSEMFDTPFGVKRGFIDTFADLTFGGAMDFTVRDIACFDKITDSDEKSIPVISSTQRFNIKNYAKDFLSTGKQPTDKWGKPITGAEIRGSYLTLPADYSGEVLFTYKRQPAPIKSGYMNEEIDISAECEHLLPLLTAAYLWLDDDGEKAQYYMSLYREAMDRIKRYDAASTDTSFNDVLRWV